MIVYNTSCQKGLYVFCFIANICGGKILLSDLAKILYIADKKHLNDWGRVIYGENYQAGLTGPTPIFLNTIITNNYQLQKNYQEIKTSVQIKDNYLTVLPTAHPNLTFFSETDCQVLENATMLVTMGNVNNIQEFYQDQAWRSTQIYGIINGADLIDQNLPGRKDFIDDLEFMCKQQVF